MIFRSGHVNDTLIIEEKQGRLDGMIGICILCIFHVGMFGNLKAVFQVQGIGRYLRDRTNRHKPVVTERSLESGSKANQGVP